MNDQSLGNQNRPDKCRSCYVELEFITNPKVDKLLISALSFKADRNHEVTFYCRLVLVRSFAQFACKTQASVTLLRCGLYALRQALSNSPCVSGIVILPARRFNISSTLRPLSIPLQCSAFRFDVHLYVFRAFAVQYAARFSLPPSTRLVNPPAKDDAL